MSIFKRGKIYWYKFMWNGEMVRESTKQGSDKKARNIESAHRTRLSKQEDARKDACSRFKCSEVLLCDECEKWFSAEDARREGEHVFCSDSCSAAWTKRHTRVPALAQFLKDDFLPYTEAHFATKPATANYYAYGASLLLAAELGTLRLDEITSQHAVGFIALNTKRSASTVNCGLRTLCRSLKLAEEWGKLERAPKLVLAKGERQRDRIVTEADFAAYIELCRQPWRDVATLIRYEGICPGECYELRWEHVLLNEHGGMIQIIKGKTKARRRVLPMTAEVYWTLKERHEAQNRPAEGWVFPAASKSGHLEESSAKHYHGKAIAKLEAASAAYEAWTKEGGRGSWQDAVIAASKLEADYVARHAEAIKAGVKQFEPYCLRHTALTRLAESGCDAFTLARIAGHSSITITQRYCHPQADAIERAFGKLTGGHNFRHREELPALEAPSLVPVNDSQD